jgi:hypothetical protein
MSSLAVGSYKTTTGPVQLSRAFSSVVSVLLIHVSATRTQSIQFVQETALVLKPISEIQAQTPSYMEENPTDMATMNSNPGGGKSDFLFFKTTQTDFGTHPASYSIGTGVLFRE